MRLMLELGVAAEAGNRGILLIPVQGLVLVLPCLVYVSLLLLLLLQLVLVLMSMSMSMLKRGYLEW